MSIICIHKFLNYLLLFYWFSDHLNTIPVRIWPKICSNSNEFNVVLPVLLKKIIAIQLLSLVCSMNLVGCPCSNVANTAFNNLSAFSLDHLPVSSRHTTASNEKKFMSLPVRTDVFKYSFFSRTITDWNSLSLAVRLSQSTQSFHGALLNSASSNHCWSSWHSGDNGWSAPIAGYRGLWTFRPFTGRFAPKTFRPWTFCHQDVSPPGRFAHLLDVSPPTVVVSPPSVDFSAPLVSCNFRNVLLR